MINNIKKEKVRFYLWTSIGYFVFVLLLELHEKETFGLRVINTLWRMPYMVFLNIIFLEYILPFIKLRWQRLILTPFLLGISLPFFSAGLLVWRGLGIELGIHTDLTKPHAKESLFEAQVGIVAFSWFLFGITKHVYEYIKLRKAAQLLKMEKQQAELNYLKSQTNPHFLFNTLNNIYSLARDKSDLAPESIMRLSKILRFMLYETGGAYISVEQELQVIEDYIALEKLRYDESLRINYSRNIEDMKQGIPPLLLMPLVENAFKHGVSETRGLPYIDIHLTIQNRRLNFTVKNSVDNYSGDITVTENIGLSNLRRQLELLYTDYSLEIKPGQSEFTATLQINLATHV